MAIYSNPQNWTVLPSGQSSGSVSCGPNRGSYNWNTSGVLQIAWHDGEPPVEAVQLPGQHVLRSTTAIIGRGNLAARLGRLIAGPTFKR
jgi:hypothetical protein